MRKMLVYIILALLVIGLGIFAVSCTLNPLRKSEEDIRTAILEITPIGMSINDTLSAIENKGWISDGINHLRGVSSVEIQALNETVGSKSIKANVGEYTIFFETRVLVWWAFDEDSKLLDVFVRKDIHGF